MISLRATMAYSSALILPTAASRYHGTAAIFDAHSAAPPSRFSRMTSHMSSNGLAAAPPPPLATSPAACDARYCAAAVGRTGLCQLREREQSSAAHAHRAAADVTVVRIGQLRDDQRHVRRIHARMQGANLESGASAHAALDVRVGELLEKFFDL